MARIPPCAELCPPGRTNKPGHGQTGPVHPRSRGARDRGRTQSQSARVPSGSRTSSFHRQRVCSDTRSSDVPHRAPSPGLTPARTRWRRPFQSAATRTRSQSERVPCGLRTEATARCRGSTRPRTGSSPRSTSAGTPRRRCRRRRCLGGRRLAASTRAAFPASRDRPRTTGYSLFTLPTGPFRGRERAGDTVRVCLAVLATGQWGGLTRAGPPSGLWSAGACALLPRARARGGEGRQGG